MPYTATVWQDNVTLGNQTRMNNLESQFLQSMTSINKDIVGAGFVLSGYTAVKDGVTANLLDVAAGRAYLVQTGSNNDLGLVALGATTQTTSTINTTYHLYLQPNGTWYWSTSNSPAANSLAICNVTTDGSGNILAVTDARTLNPTLLTLAGNVKTTGQFYWGGALGGSNKQMLQMLPSDTGDNWVFNYITDFSLGWFDATTSKTPLRMFNTGGIQTDSGAIATNGSGAFTKLGNVATAGSFGVPVVVAQLVRSHVIATGLATLLTYAVTTTGVYRVSGYISLNNGSADPAISATVGSTDPDTSTATAENFFTGKVPLSGGTAHSPTLLDGVATFGRNNSNIVLAPLLVAAVSGSNILCNYNDPTGTPSDFVSFIIERLA